MTSDEAAAILGVDDDTIADLEDLLDLDGSWTIADLQSASEILDEAEAEDGDEDGDEDEDRDEDGDEDG